MADARQTFVDLELKPYADQYADHFDWGGVWRELRWERQLIYFDGVVFRWVFPDTDALFDALRHNDMDKED